LKILFGAYLREKCADEEHDDPHDMLDSLCNTMQQWKCVVFNKGGTVFESVQMQCVHSIVTDCSMTMLSICKVLVRRRLWVHMW